MFKKISWGLLIITLFTGLVLSEERVSAKDLSVEEIVNKTYTAAYYQGEDGKATVEMTIVDAQGRKRVRRLTMLRKDIEDNGQQKYYAYFKEPADVRKMVFMVDKRPSTEDNRWLYLPALDLVRRVSAADKRSSFVGSHFTYEDISGRNLTDDKHILLGEENGKYILKLIPKDKNNVEFAYYKMWINKDNFIPVRSEYYNQQEELYRVITAEKVENIEGYPTIMTMKAEDLKTGAYTINRFSNIQYNLGISENIFTERYLRRPPRRLLR
ncbi:outer membrane lipoprotein-sorting protein [Orenia marismortui]|uniref:Outer membrane lipoprotein-sorting protein n=1 Tax=Orenia marismortui TaxID=46469 RepID=A0A4R8GYB2_9FIRM|nr:outer membrane lipoprotein-sorting protein [Orenia marismortui]TDX51434.1 outer membrane lipoprotein-sorting protein [Orenia marismortui]